MKKRVCWILIGMLVIALLGGCAEEVQPTVEEPPAKVEVSAAEVLATHREAVEADKQAVMVVEADEVTIEEYAELIEILAYDDWKEIQREDAITIIAVFIGGDELSFFEGGRVRLWTGNDEAWFAIPEEVLAELQELWRLESTPTDEARISDNRWMWKRYMYDTITSLGNTKYFDANDLTEIDGLVEYAWRRYSREFDSPEAMGFEHSSDVSAYYLFPREIAYEEAKKYFAFDISKANLEDSRMYLEEADAFQMQYTKLEEDHVSGSNPWGIYYEGIKLLEDNRYEARMVSYEDRQAGIVRRENVYILSVSDDGTFLFESGERRMPFYPVTDFSDDIQPLASWSGSVGEYANMIGESESEVFFLETDEGVKIHCARKSDLKLDRTMILQLKPEEKLVQMHETEDGKQFLVCTSHYVRVFDEKWEEIEVIALPASFTEKVLSEITWDESVQFKLKSIFTSYDVTDDLTHIAYGDEEGLKTFELGVDDPEVVLLEKSEEHPDSELSKVSVYLSPRWVDGGRKIYVARSGYEGNRGIGLYDLDERKMNRYSHGWIVWSNQIQPGKGVMMPEEYEHNWETGEGRYLHFYLDFETGEQSEFTLDRMGGGDMSDDGEWYYGENAFALLVQDYEVKPKVSYVQRIDPETEELIDETVIKAARVRILGVDRAGNIFVYYFYNQESRGFGVISAGDHRTEERYALSDFCGEALPLDAWEEEMVGNALYSRPQLIGETDRECFFDGQRKIYRIDKTDYNKIGIVSFDYGDGEYNKLVKPIPGNRYVAGTNRNLHIFNADWEEEQVIALPNFFRELLASDGKRESSIVPCTMTWYDVSEDLTWIVFSNETGLNIFWLGEEEPEVRLLAELEDTGQDWTSVYIWPQFVDGDRKIFFKRSGREEALRGVGLYDLDKEEMSLHDIGGGTVTIAVLPEQGAFVPGERDWANPRSKKGAWHVYLDFQTGETKEFTLELTDSYSWDAMDVACHGERFLLSLAEEANPDTQGGTITHIQVIDLETLEQVRDVEVKSVMVQLMGIDRTGNVFFHYRLNEHFQGYGVIPSEDGQE